MTRRETPIGIVLTWYAAVVAGLLWGPGLLAFDSHFWELPGDNVLLVSALAGAFVLCAVASVLVRGHGGWSEVGNSISLAAVGLSAVYLLVLLMNRPEYSRLLLISGSVLFVAGLALPALFSVSRRLLALSLLGGAVIGAALVGVNSLLVDDGPRGSGLKSLVAGLLESGADPESVRREEVVPTNRHTLVATFYADYLASQREPAVSGGALATDPEGPGLYLARARGEIYRVSWGDSARLDLGDTGLRVPINNAAFESETGSGVAKEWFRVADVLALPRGDSIRLLASHHFWKRDDDCFVVRISSLILPPEFHEPGASVDRRSWDTVWESEPCLPIKHGARGVPFAGLQIGGNLAALNGDSVLLTVGDHQFDGWYGTPNYVQDPDADYGKTLLIDLSTGESEVFTTGHRNAQGLTVDSRGRIWATEHGPEGGDELNLLRRGGDYGWPYHSYGTDYGSVTWPLNDSADSGDFLRPTYAWVPSIGVSEVVAVREEAYPRWRDDLLVAALKGQELWRLELDGERVVSAEPIPIGERVRDIVPTDQGEFVLWTDQRNLVRLAAATTRDRGAAVFATQCGGCHGTGYEMKHGIGPNLRGVFDRPIASAGGFDYSSALADLEGRWTTATMDAFLANPDSMVPGTTMAFEGIDDSDVRESLIEYLRSVD